MAYERKFQMLIDQIDGLNPIEAVKKAMSLKRNQKQILDINRNQLRKGLDSLDDSLGKYASPKYKGRLKPVDLFHKGDFYKSLFLEVTSRGYTLYMFIGSKDWKNVKLTRKYGSAIRGISPRLYPAVFDIIRDDFDRYFKQQAKNARTR